MAILSGTERDLYVRKYSDAIDVALRQAGGLLTQAVSIEPGVMGDRTIFKRFGDVSDATENTVRFNPIEFSQINSEARYVTPKLLDNGVHIDPLDLLRMSDSVNPEIVAAITNSIRKQEDKIILAAMGGTAAREVDGSASNASFDSNQTIAQDVNTYAATTLSGDTALHEGKIQNALLKLEQNFVDLSAEDVFVILTAKQAAALRTRISTLGWSRNDFIGRLPLNVRGAVPALSGFMGCNYILYQPLGDTDQLVSGDEYVYVTTRPAVKMGVWKPMEVTIDKDMTQRGHPDRIYAQETVGAVRMDESRIVRIECDV